MLDDEDLSLALSSLDRTTEPGRAAADDDRVKLHLSEVPIFQYIQMMPYMAGHNVDQSTDGD